MFRGFKINGIENLNKGPIYQEGVRIFEQQKKIVDAKLKLFVNGDNSLDGKKIQENWFPQIDAHVFISHSHVDKDMAIYLAGWLFKHFKIVSFIDSLIWGHADKLLKEIDNDYCKNEDKATYDYEKRNYSTSHVHMMLSTALAKMIDQTECLFFLETPNSIKPSDEIKNKTKSAWIYFEITMTQIVEERIPIRAKNLVETKMYNKRGYFNKGFVMEHEVDLKHLTELTENSFSNWKSKRLSCLTPEDGLDELYDLNPPKQISNILQK